MNSSILCLQAQSGAPSGFSDLAAATRFAPSGVIDVRDEDTYRADLGRTRFAADGAVVGQLSASRTAMRQYGSDGRPFTTGLGIGGLNAEELAVGGRVFVGPTGRVWWNLRRNFPVLAGFPYLLVTE